MRPQAKIDVEAVHLLINSVGKKNLDDTMMTAVRAKKAISSMIKTDPAQGYFAYALFLNHFNQNQEALEYIQKAKNLCLQDDVNFDFLTAELEICTAMGDWSKIKKSLSQVSNNFEKNINLYTKDKMSDVFQQLASLSVSYLDNEEIKNIVSYNSSHIRAMIKKKIQYLDQISVDIETYRRVIALMDKTLLSNYRLQSTITEVDPIEGDLISVITYTDLPATEVSELNNILIDNIIDEFEDSDRLEQTMKINAMFMTSFGKFSAEVA